jgi:hypothetical protein
MKEMWRFKLGQENPAMNLEQLRRAYHEAICQHVLGYRAGALNIADKSSERSIELAQGILTRMGFPSCPNPPEGQRAGALFESLTRDYLEKAFRLIQHLRPGDWTFSVHGDAPVFDQYEHLTDLAEVLGQHSHLRATLGDYLVTPDIVVGRSPVSDQQINRDADILQGDTATLTPLRASNFPDPRPILHASISCKWTIRSDRSQNARTEGLNLIRNRKGSTPHIVIVTAEPLPSRIASVALGTGDVDCVYHMALYELGESVKEVGDETLSEMYNLLVDGKRLRDISDLPFDLAI